MTDQNDEKYGDEAHQREIAMEAARATVQQMFRELGYDTRDVESVRELQRDLAWVRDARHKGEQVGDYIRKATIWTLVGAALVAVWFGIETKVGQ